MKNAFLHLRLASIVVCCTLLIGCAPSSSPPISTATPTSASPTEIPSPSPTTLPTKSQLPNATTTPNLLPTVSPTPSGESLFDTLLVPFITEAKKQRLERAKTDTQYTKRIDTQLNEGRVNFLLFGYGETHEPPATEKAIIGSYTIVSYDILNRHADLVSFTHDIRAPEIETELRLRTKNVPVQRIDKAFDVGGFPLMRKVIEDATGLSIDYQVTFKDTVIQRLIDQVFDGVQVDIPEAFDVQPFYLEGKKYPAGHFPKGIQTLRGAQVIQFIKTVPTTEGYYGKSLEHNARKHLVFQAILDTLAKQSASKSFWLKLSTFLTTEMVTREIVYDFDPVALMIGNIGNVIAGLEKYTSGKSSGLGMPHIEDTKYIVDSTHGDGGVQWINPYTHDPFIIRDVQNGVYSAFYDTEVPFNANPYGDPATEYWTSVRALVKQSFGAPPSIANASPTATTLAIAQTPEATKTRVQTVFIPKTGDIVAKTMAKGHPTGFVLITSEGQRVPIGENVYKSRSDQSLSPDGSIRLVVTDNAVMAHSTNFLGAPGSIAKTGSKTKLASPAVIGSRGWHGVVSQNKREVLLFEIRDSQLDQGVIYTLPQGYQSIDYISWGAGKTANDLVLTLRTDWDHVQVYRLTPTIQYPLSAEASKECGVTGHALNGCVIQYFRKMPKELVLISDSEDYAASAVR